jgi:Fe-S-cluster containining protein
VIKLNFENVTFPDSVGFCCKKCGLCCKEQPADLNKKEQQKIEAGRFTDFLGEIDEIEEFKFIRRKKDGGCFFLTKNNECMIYEVRPATCRLVPFTITDWDYERNIIEVELPPESECKGIFEGKTLPVEEMGRAAQTIVQDLLEITAKTLGLPITDKKILSKTRILLMGMIGQDVK